MGFAVFQFKRPQIANVRLTRTLEKIQINEDETCRVRLSVNNEGANDIPFLQIRDEIPRDIQGDNTRNGFSITLRAGESRNLLYEVRGNYFGEYSIGPIVLSAQDSLGLVETKERRNIVSKVVVFPKTAGKLTGFTIGPRTTRLRPGEIRANRVGTGMDYFTTTQLLLGESAKRINWRASARLAEKDELLSNKFTAQQVAETLIVLDCRSDSGTSKDRKDSITSYSVRAAMSLSERLLRDKNRVGFLAVGSVSQRVSPSYGRRQYDRIALTLARLEVGGRFSSESISSTIRYFYPRVSQVVLISPLMDYGNLDIALDLARGSRSFDLMIVSPNPLDFPLDRSPELSLKASREGKIGWRLAKMERNTTITQLETSGAIVLDWRVFVPFEQVVAAYRHMASRQIARLARR